MAFLIKNWKWISSAFGAAIVTAYLCWLGHTYLMNKQADEYMAEMVKQEKALAAECAADKAITEKVSYDLQNKTASLNRQLADARRMFDNACVPVSGSANPAAGHDGTTLGTKPVGQNDYGNSIRATRLLDIAAEGEQYRLQLIACQSFIKSTWDRRK